MSAPSPFPAAQQAQIIRANQRDIYHVSSLREQTESVLRAWLGTRWLTRWTHEVELGVKLLYGGLSTGRGLQTLGEEYTDVWQESALTGRQPGVRVRGALVVLPALVPYVLARWRARGTWAAVVPGVLAGVVELNLAIFYLRGTYYTLAKRVLGTRYIASLPQDPHMRPPSYALLGILLGVRLVHRVLSRLRVRGAGPVEVESNTAGYLDTRAVGTLVGVEGDTTVTAEEDEYTVVDVGGMSGEERDGRKCTLCLEERTGSCATECGHVFCWVCIVGWGREKAECPLCRQTLNLTRLLPVYNL